MRTLALKPCPQSGTGVHRWLFHAACYLHDAGTPAEEAAEQIAEGIAASDPHRVDRAEIRRTVMKVWQGPVSTPTWPRAVSRTAKPRPMWPRVVEIVKSGPRQADLWEASPVRMDEDAPDTEAIIDMLFPGNPLLCVAKAKPADAATAPREAFRGKLASSALIVPSPMSALTGLTQDGRESVRCLSNTGPRRFLVIEMDFKVTSPEKLTTLEGDALEAARTVNALLATGLPSQDLCAALLWHLTTVHGGRLVAVVHSGGKSLHGWFDVRGVDDAALDSWFRVAVRLGADPATFCPCQLVRLPEGRRENGAPQHVVYFNPSALERRAA